MWGEEGRKKERLPLEAETEAKTVEQEDETVSETVEQEDETVSKTIEQKLNLWESKGGEGEGTKPETMNQNVGDRNLNRVTEGKGIVTVKKHQVWQRDVDEKVLGVGLGLGLAL